MPRYNLSCQITVSAYTIVDADSLEDAVEEARDRDVELHFNGSGTDPKKVWCVSEPDGDLFDITGAEDS